MKKIAAISAALILLNSCNNSVKEPSAEATNTASTTPSNIHALSTSVYPRPTFYCFATWRGPGCQVFGPDGSGFLTNTGKLFFAHRGGSKITIQVWFRNISGWAWNLIPWLGQTCYIEKFSVCEIRVPNDAYVAYYVEYPEVPWWGSAGGYSQLFDTRPW